MDANKQLLLFVNEEYQSNFEDYRPFEEAFFAFVRDELADPHVDYDYVLNHAKNAKERARLGHTAIVLSHVSNGVYNPVSPPEKDLPVQYAAFWHKEYRPAFPDWPKNDRMIQMFGLQRGIMVDRLEQFLETGSN